MRNSPIGILCLISTVTFGILTNCSAPRPAILVDLDEIARSHVCDEPQSYRAYWWLYGSLPLSMPEAYAVSEEPSTLNVIQVKRTTLDYTMTIFLGTLFSITTAEIEVRRCVATGENSLKAVQEQRDAAPEQERRRKEAEIRAEKQRLKKENH